ncbi:MAG: hypothetical protein KF716_31470 [Anaerolineae bacterium]|nr:hypothetical protein [Anaerolineae bacterium]
MLKNRRGQWLLAGVIIAALIVTTLPAVTPVSAATAVVGRFYATCSTFSVDLAVNGTGDDGGGLDKFRYQITDGNNKKLYLEDATRPVNNTQGRVVVGVAYDADGVVDGPPTKNPIRLTIIDLNNAGAIVGTLFTASYDAECLPASGTATFHGNFQPPARFHAQINVTTPLLLTPGGAQINNLVAEAGKDFIAVYKSADSQYISIFVGSSNLPWIATGAATVDIANLPVQPTRIETVTVVPIATPFPVVIGTATPIPGGVLPPTNVSAYVRVRLRLRQQPSTLALILLTIPARTYVPVYGRDFSGVFIKVGYNGLIGWVAVSYTRLSGATLSQLPIVQ